MAAGRRPDAVSRRPADRGAAGGAGCPDLAVVPAQARAGGPGRPALVLALVIGFAGITWNWREAVRTAERSRPSTRRKGIRSAAKADAINRFLIDKLLGQAEPGTNPNAKHVTLLETIDRAAAEVGASLAGQPETEATIRMALGKVYHDLTEYAESEAHSRRSLQFTQRAHR